MAIRLEAIKDTVTLDYQKNWLCLTRQRFVFRKVAVLASFNQIKGVAVSCRPEPFSRLVFSGASKCYAIVLLDLNNKLIFLTDHNLTLSEANIFASNLCSRHLTGAQLLPGEPDKVIEFDHVTGMLKLKSESAMVSTYIEALLRPMLQSFIAFCGTSTTLAAITILLASLSQSIFNTDLLIARQPVIQLMNRQINPAEHAIVITLHDNPEPVLPVSVQSEELPFSTNASDSEPLILDLFAQKVITRQETATNTESAPKTENQLPDKQEPAKSTSPQMEPENNPVTPEPAVATSEKPQLPDVPDKIDISAKAHFRQTDMAKHHAPVLSPLPSRIPDIDLQNDVSEKMPVKLISAAKKAEKTDMILNLPTIPRKLQIIPGKGLAGLLKIGDLLSIAAGTLGKPLSATVSSHGKRKIYSGLTIESTGNPDRISRIIITGQVNNALGIFFINNDIAVGSPIESVKTSFGPATLIPEVAGLHYPETGISFFPAPGKADRIGAIQIYPKGGNPFSN